MSLPTYPKYKDSGVEWLGQVPEHWDVTPLRRLIDGTVINGLFKKKDQFGSGTLLLNVFDVYQRNFLVNYEKLDRVICTVGEQAAYAVRSGDLFFVRSSLKQEGIAVVCVAGSYGEPAVFECHLVRARPSPNLLDGRYASYVLNSPAHRAILIGNAKVTTMTTIDQEAILSTPIHQPPLPEQRAIASFLDRETSKIDALVAEQRKLIELLKEKRQAVISHAVTKGLNPNAPMKRSGIEWLGMVPKHWEVKVLRRFNCKVQTGPFGSQLHAEEYISGGTPVVNPTHMVNGSIVPSDEITVSDDVLARLPHQRLEVGDVIFSRRGELGRCALVTETEVGWLCGTGSMILRLHHSEYIGGYLSLFLSLDVLRQYFESFSIGTVMDSLSSETLLAMPLVVPPINEQLFIVQFVATQSAVIDSLVAAAKLAVDLLQERRTALISAAVTGKIDVRCHGEPSASNRMSYEAQLS